MEGNNIDSIHLIGLVFSVTTIVAVFFMVRERMLKEKYSLVWFLIGFFTLVMSIFKDLMDWFANLIGVYYAPSAFFVILIACAYFLLLNMSVSISALKTHNKVLTQELGLTKLRLEEVEKKMKSREL